MIAVSTSSTELLCKRAQLGGARNKNTHRDSSRPARFLFFRRPTLLNIFKDPLGPSLRLREKGLIKGLGQTLIKPCALNCGFNKHRKQGGVKVYPELSNKN
jgi:hypothetical protein